MNPYWQKRCVRCGNAYDPIHKHHTYRKVNDRETVVDLCYRCHQWVHLNPALAEKEGYYEKLSTVDRKVVV